ncbi:MAG TPA: tetratricopeptide repeat protein [Xanthomonadaceae bacterium]|jgi:tetratricopeptide (TPR) repeat protein
MQVSRVLKTTGMAMAIACVSVSTAMAQDLHERYLEIKREYDNAHQGKKYVKVQGVQAQLFPNATRVDPGLFASDHMAKPLAELTDLANDGGHDGQAIALGEKLAADSKATPYDLAKVFEALGLAHLDEHDSAKGIEYVRKALDENTLSNNDQYTLMLQLVDAQIDLGQPEAGLATLARLVAETGEDKPEYEGRRGHLYYQKKDYAAAAQALQKSIDQSAQADPFEQQMLMDSYFRLRQYDHAAKAGEAIVQAHPDDPSAMMNLVTVYRQARQVDKMLALLEETHRRGALTTEGYKVLYDLYARTKGREGDGAALIDEGLQKGILRPGEKVYMALAQDYCATHQIEQAIDAYTKADAVATDGEAALGLAEIYNLERRPAEARAAATRALQKGVFDPGWARIIIARQEKPFKWDGKKTADTSDWQPWDSH